MAAEDQLVFSPLLVVSHLESPDLIKVEGGKPQISREEETADALDRFNHPRFRRALILKVLQSNNGGGEGFSPRIQFMTPTTMEQGLAFYKDVHDAGLLEFLLNSWAKWAELGKEGRDASAFHTLPTGAYATEFHTLPTAASTVPALTPINFLLARDPHQRPSKNVMGQVGYYCSDECTPVFSSLREELLMDASIVKTAVQEALLHSSVVYALPTHPGHHAAYLNFGGYCYVNHAAAAAKYLQKQLQGSKVAVLDVDYHCGNGTASIFYEDPSVMVVSIHCDPDYDYPFHSGFADQTGDGEGLGTTVHLPLAPGTTWEVSYKEALATALDRIEAFGAKALVVSLGLDTYKDDPCTIRGGGFALSGDDYQEMGKMLGVKRQGLPTVIIQEGGYRMDAVGKAATDVALGCSDPK